MTFTIRRLCNHVGRVIALCVLIYFPLFAQKKEFEVASIKPCPLIISINLNASSGKANLPKFGMSIDEARVDIFHMNIRDLLMYAHDLKQYQIVGPDWMSSQFFEIHAKIPGGASKNDVPEMLRSLLVERFKIVSHKEYIEMPVYELKVSQEGHKLKEGAALATENTHEAPIKDADKGGRLSEMPLSSKELGQGRIKISPEGSIYEFSNIGMPQFAAFLSRHVGRLVVDKTKLKGVFQASILLPLAALTSASPFSNRGSGSIAGSTLIKTDQLGRIDVADDSIFSAVQKLGLKLEPQKASSVETLIIESIEKSPTED